MKLLEPWLRYGVYEASRETESAKYVSGWCCVFWKETAFLRSSEWSGVFWEGDARKASCLWFSMVKFSLGRTRVWGCHLPCAGELGVLLTKIWFENEGTVDDVDDPRCVSVLHLCNWRLSGGYGVPGDDVHDPRCACSKSNPMCWTSGSGTESAAGGSFTVHGRGSSRWCFYTHRRENTLVQHAVNEVKPVSM